MPGSLCSLPCPRRCLGLTASASFVPEAGLGLSPLGPNGKLRPKENRRVQNARGPLRSARASGGQASSAEPGDGHLGGGSGPGLRVEQGDGQSLLRGSVLEGRDPAVGIPATLPPQTSPAAAGREAWPPRGQRWPSRPPGPCREVTQTTRPREDAAPPRRHTEPAGCMSRRRPPWADAAPSPGSRSGDLLSSETPSPRAVRSQGQSRRSRGRTDKGPERGGDGGLTRSPPCHCRCGNSGPRGWSDPEGGVKVKAPRLLQQGKEAGPVRPGETRWLLRGPVCPSNPQPSGPRRPVPACAPNGSSLRLWRGVPERGCSDPEWGDLTSLEPSLRDGRQGGQPPASSN